MSIPPIRPTNQPSPSDITPVANSTGMQSLAHIVQEAMQISTEPTQAILNPTFVNSIALPDEILLHCFIHLDFKTLAKICSRVCKQFKRVAEDNQVWKLLLARDLRIGLRRCSNPKEIYRNFFLGRCEKTVVQLPLSTVCVQRLNHIRDHILIGSQDGTISLYDLVTEHAEPIVGLLSPIRGLEVKDFRIFCGTAAGTIGIIDSRQNEADSCKAFKLFPHDSPFNPIHKICLFNELLVISHSGVTSILNIKNDKRVGLLNHLGDNEDTEDTNTSALAVDEKYICVGFEDGSIEIWTQLNLQKLKHFQAHEEDISCIQIVGNHLYSCSANDNKIKVWDITVGNLVREIVGNNDGGITTFYVHGPYVFFDHFNQVKMKHLGTGHCSVLTDLQVDENSIIRTLWVHGAEVVAATDNTIYRYSFASDETNWEI